MSGMNFLERLLDGVTVEWKPLGEVSRLITKGTTPQKFVDSGINFVKTESLENGRINPQKFMFVSQETHEKELKRSILEANDILFAIAGSIGKCTVVEESILPANTNQALAIIRLDETVNVRFVFYCMQTLAMQEYIAKYNKASAQPNLNLQQIGNFPIPIPCPDKPDRSLAIQAEIVQILDTFTALTAELTAALTAELSDRKKQYNYYRDRLLTFEEGEAEWKTLGDLAENLDFMRKPVTSGLRDSGEIPYYGASGIVDYVKDYIFDGDFLLVSEDGANLIARNTPIAFSISGKSWVNNHAHILKFNTYAERKYIEYYLNSIDLTPYISGAAQPKLNQKNLNSIKIPNPSPHEKERIVGILDKFDTLTHSISEGLPREIELRQKQYEYYRDLLLSFPPPLTP
ncbi:MAG: restriction endonuclease subunit S, partial [Pseudanabaena sp.]